MRIVIDLQGGQSTGSRNRGIGRYSLSIALAIARKRKEHEVLIVLSGAFADTIDPLCAAFSGILPPENIRVWESVSPVGHVGAENIHRRHAAEYIREAFIENLKPDVVYVTSFFEGIGDDVVTSIGRLNTGIPTVVTLYDLIPLLYPSQYLQDTRVAAWYEEKITFVRKASMLLAISNSARNDAILHLGIDPLRVVNISGAAEAHFKPIAVDETTRNEVLARHALTRPFVMYTGGIDHRKNIEGLIHAYSHLPISLRDQHQLAIVCSISPEAREMLEKLTAECGLSKDEIRLTGFVSDEDLVVLYNLSKAFVFPSLYEGFGLPVLEAMSCGIATIASNTSSIPEVIGRADALFNPDSNAEITAKLQEVLENDDFRKDLARSGLEMARLFSWDASADVALEAIERVHSLDCKSRQMTVSDKRMKLAYLSPLPPQRTGIADYSAELVPMLGQHYDITLITPQKDVDNSLKFSIQTPSWLLEHRHEFDRVLYHFGNSAYHSYMFEMLEELAGVVVLHDFFLGDVIEYLEHNEGVKGAWTSAIFHSHGYPALVEKAKENESYRTTSRYPGNLKVLQKARGVIVHSEYSRDLSTVWYGNGAGNDWSVIPHLKIAVDSMSRASARNALDLPEDSFVVCSFGLMGYNKLNARLLQAWLDSSVAKTPGAVLVFVGENSPNEYGENIIRKICASGLSDQIRITGWASKDSYKSYLAAADLAVQLRTSSRGETSGTVLDCMNHGIPVITNSNGTFTELDQDAVWMLPDAFEEHELTHALETLYKSPSKRAEIGSNASEAIRRYHDPDVCARMFTNAIEQYYQNHAVTTQDLVTRIAGNGMFNLPNSDIAEISCAIARNLPRKLGLKSLFVDVTGLCKVDAKTEIQNFSKNLLCEILKISPPGYRVEPIYAELGVEGFRYARDFTLSFLGGQSINSIPDLPIDFTRDDVFLSFNLFPDVILDQERSLKTLKQRGVFMHFVVYDIPSTSFGNYTSDVEDIGANFSKWLKCLLGCSSNLHCISQVTASDLSLWATKLNPGCSRLPPIVQFRLGTEFERRIESKRLMDARLEATISKRPAFLSAHTFESGGNQDQILNAFELLWEDGFDVNLIVARTEGLNIGNLVNRYRRHREKGKRFFLLDRLADDCLSSIYQICNASIVIWAPDGIGLPLIEAAKHKIPLIISDTPTFREIAGNHAFYYKGGESEDLAEAVKRWKVMNDSGVAPQSAGISPLSLNQSARELIVGMDLIISNDPK